MAYGGTAAGWGPTGGPSTGGPSTGGPSTGGPSPRVSLSAPSTASVSNKVQKINKSLHSPARRHVNLTDDFRMRREREAGGREVSAAGGLWRC